MPMGKGASLFLATSPINLALWGGVLAWQGVTGTPGLSWGAQVWLLTVGFAGMTILGFWAHLFPSLSARPLRRDWTDVPRYVLAEGAVLGGVLSIGVGTEAVPPSAFFPLSLLVWLLATVLTVVPFLKAMGGPSRLVPPGRSRPGDTMVRPLLFGAIISSLVAPILWLVSASFPGPGLGFWITGIHVFVLGEAVPLLFAVMHRMLPRALGEDPPRWVVACLPPLALLGAALVPAGMLSYGYVGSRGLSILALPEATAALLFLFSLVSMVRRARTPKPFGSLYVVSAACLIVGGGIGMAMVGSSNFRYVEPHAVINLLGFLGITITGMYFSMIAPFQFVSHAWTVRIMRGEMLLLLVGTAFFTLSTAVIPLGRMPEIAAGTMVVSGALIWEWGSLPVLFHGGGRPKGTPASRG